MGIERKKDENQDWGCGVHVFLKTFGMRKNNERGGRLERQKVYSSTVQY